MANREKIAVRGLTMAFGDFVVQRDLDFAIREGEIFVIMGGSGFGKSTLLRHFVGLLEPTAGEVFFDGQSFTRADAKERDAIVRRCGVLYQQGALWSNLTLIENVAFPLEEYSPRSPAAIAELARY
ncbi:MAG: ATP-binding cassette domain-containing protein, partial [Verrucomicrobiota bacterium]